MMTRVGPLDRFDVCAAYNLWLQASHGGQGSSEYARLSKLTGYYKPSRSEEYTWGLSEDALRLYLALSSYPHPFVDAGCGRKPTFFQFAFGAYGDTHLLVRADHLEDALEAAFEWLDDNAPDLLSKLDWDEAAQECGYESFADAEAKLGSDCDSLAEVIEQAEIDMTVCTHTTLKHGDCIPSYEWSVSEVEP